MTIEKPAPGRPVQQGREPRSRPGPMPVGKQFLQRRIGAAQIVAQPRRGSDGLPATLSGSVPRTPHPKTLSKVLRTPPGAMTIKGPSAPTSGRVNQPHVGAVVVANAPQRDVLPANGDAAGCSLVYPIAPEAAADATNAKTMTRKRVKRHRPMRDPHALGPDDLMTNAEMCRYLHISDKTSRNWATRGYGPQRHVVSARCIRFRKRDVDDWLAARRVRSTSETIADA